ncbi:uncharacterized protein N7511_005586 [Penicillium nucicola]|uniref:uncharacterized protein n=1 Tax=Penicillium nucicola TaxID=1850975 RepID=UPI0025458082|nr:uncharacterized protein N7511_005586 [Penicillium nucicola]KAJ5762204.1 hypothetical protein N7511_005586 [Penicillium nucicola]
MSKYDKSLSQIDAAHSEDPRQHETPTGPIPYELHYAQKMTKYLETLNPHADELLRLAIRAQHLRRWEVPRDSYPMTKIGYHSWRAGLQRRQAEIVQGICVGNGYSVEEAERVGEMVKKTDLKKGDADTQTLEDVACLVFLDDQFDRFERELGDEGKMVDILRKTWGKMSERGREEALKISLSDNAVRLVGIALGGDS